MIGFIGVCLVHRRSRRRVLDPPGFDLLEAGLGDADRFLDTAAAGAATAAGAAAAAADAPSADTRLVADFGFAADACAADACACAADACACAAEALGATGVEARNNSCLKSN